MIGATIIREMKLLLRDRGRLLMMFAMPIVFIVVFGSMFKFGPDQGKPKAIAIWHAADNTWGINIEKSLNATPGFIAEPTSSPDDVRRAVAKEDVAAGIVVPSGHERLELVIDLGAPIQVRGPLEAALVNVVQMSPQARDYEVLPMPYDVKSPPGIARPLENASSFQVTVPGNAVLFGFFIAMAVAISFAHERNTGTWKRLLAAPVARWKLLVGKLVPYLFVSLGQLAILFGIGAFVFGMKVAGSVGALALLSLGVSLSAVSFGMLVASFGGTERQIGSTVPVFILVMGLLGGCMFPRLFMPDFMKKLGLCVPHSWALDGYYDVLIRQGTTIADIGHPLLALLGFTVVFLGLGIWRFEFER